MSGVTQRKVKLKYSPDILLTVLFFAVPMVDYVHYLLHGYVFTFAIFILWVFYIGRRKEGFSTLSLALRNRRKELFWLFLFVFIICYSFFFRSTNDLAKQCAIIFISLVLIILMDSYYSIYNPRYKLSILWWIAIILGVQALYAIPYLFSHMGYVARLYTSGQLSDQQNLEAMKNGIGGSSLYLSQVVFLFILISSYNNFRKIGKILFLSAGACILLSILLSTFFTPIIFLVFGVVILILYFNRRILKAKVILFSFGVGFGLIYFYNNYLSNTPLLEPVIRRIQSLLYGTGSSGSLQARERLANVSWETFQNAPFFGIGIQPRHSYDLIGGHNVWIDFLASLGFLGTLPLLLFLLVLIRKNISFYFKKGNDAFYQICCFIGLLIFLLSNNITPSITQQSMLVMIFFFCLSSSNNLSNKKYLVK